MFKFFYNNTTKRLTKHCCFSLFGTATDTIVLWLCSTFLFAGSYVTENIISPFISFQFGTLVNFLVASKYVWGDRMGDKVSKRFIKKYLTFNLSYFTVFWIKMGLLLFIKALISWDVVLCNVIAVTLAGIINFFVNDRLIFRNKEGNDIVLIEPTEFTKAMDTIPGSGEVLDSEVFEED